MDEGGQWAIGGTMDVDGGEDKKCRRSISEFVEKLGSENSEFSYIYKLLTNNQNRLVIRK
jgi:hypothetical protein